MDRSNQIKFIKAKLALLDAEREQLLKKLNNIEKETTFPSKLTPTISINSSTCPSDLYNISGFSQERQIKLFRNLFRGRDDVFARLWVSRKTGKSGYSPVCKNEWVTKICQKPIMKCSGCPNRELLPLDDEVIRKHLAGRHVIGIYPMLQDETCYFLVVDFDGDDWIDNISVLRETCLEEGVPIAIERSRSGKGAHAWIFFEDKVPASLARRMGSFLITKTMSKRYQLNMKSYDRLFPNQDTLPKGGFGNLIALPFQKEAMRHGNSIFIDENGNPYTDQWVFLSSIKRMSLMDIEQFSKEVSSNKEIIGVRMSPVDENDPPWMRLPSGKRKYKPIINGLPDKIELVIADRIYVKTNGIPSVLLNQIKRLAAFQNPEFYKRQNMRLSTFLTPRVISCSEILDGYLAIPRGCLNDLSYLLNEYGLEIDIKDERVAGKRIKFRFFGSLTKEQKAASKKVIKDDIGILVAPSGMGKTVIAIYAIARRKTNTLILVHRKPLMEQWRLQLASLLGVALKDIGRIGAGKNKSNGILDIAMIQSMERKGVVDDRIIDYGFVIVDECHHVSAVSFERVLMKAKAKYVLGLTATPYRRDGHQPIIHMQCGPVCYQKRQKDIVQPISQYIIIPRTTEFKTEWSGEDSIYDLWPKLINDEKRNKLIIGDILHTLHEGRFPIILTERREHLKTLTEMLEDKIEHLIVLYGGTKPKRRKELLKELAHISPKKAKAILATGSYIGEGFDIPQLDTLFITMPISFKGRVVQYAGRLHR
ncbi:MAG: DEAD/DEAH box helicase family protein, partial [Candidatus Omnitrophica bacterium]|nr:DEAD/DEAH box helicase family protein [Candidatus Omnitrophota bacterium]